MNDTHASVYLCGQIRSVSRKIFCLQQWIDIMVGGCGEEI